MLKRIIDKRYGKITSCCLILFLIISTGCTHISSTVSGVVVDCHTSLPIHGARVSLVGWADYIVAAGPSYHYDGLTDRDGGFKIAFNKPIRKIVVSASGYRTSYLDDFSSNLNIRMLRGDPKLNAYGCRPIEDCLQSSTGSDGTVYILNTCTME